MSSEDLSTVTQEERNRLVAVLEKHHLVLGEALWVVLTNQDLEMLPIDYEAALRELVAALYPKELR